MYIIVRGSRKDLVRKQRACINEVNRVGHDHPKSAEIVEDFQRWSDESKVFKSDSGLLYQGSDKWRLHDDAKKRKGGDQQDGMQRREEETKG